jgi:hypothetical protein
MDNAFLSRIFELGMLAAFGFSWPFSIYKTWKAKRVEGKSIFFLLIVILGYIFGICSHLVTGNVPWIVWVYVLDMMLVTTDLVLFLKYRKRG